MQKGKFLFYILASCALSSSAFAKQWNFDAGTPLGFGLRAGITKNPATDVIGDPQTYSASFSKFYAIEPFLDLGNVTFRTLVQANFNSDISASTTAYGETGDIDEILYGAQLQLAPFVSKSRRHRIYGKFGYALASLSGKNKRTYTAGTVNEERFKGTGHQVLLGSGFEFFLTQNYTLQLETGYSWLKFSELKYKEGSGDLAGTKKTEGTDLTTANGNKKRFNASGAYFSLCLNLHF